MVGERATSHVRDRILRMLAVRCAEDFVGRYGYTTDPAVGTLARESVHSPTVTSGPPSFWRPPLLLSPVDTDERGEFRLFLHGDLLDLGSRRDMQRRAQRRQYGEPVERLSLSIRYGQRHTRGLEAELESVTRSPLQVRSPRVHVPLRSSRVASGCPKWNSPPISVLQSANRPSSLRSGGRRADEPHAPSPLETK